MKKLLVVGVIGLFLGLACAPSINANVSKESELVEVTTEICGLGGGKHTVQLTQEEAEEVELLIDDIERRLDGVETREETVEIFNDAVVKLDTYGLLGGLSVKQAQRLVNGGYNNPRFNRLMDILNKKYQGSLAENENWLCLIAGYTNNTVFIGPLYRIMTLLLIVSPELYLIIKLFFFMPFNAFSPINIGSTIGIGFYVWDPVNWEEIPYPANGWMMTLGLLGLKRWNGSMQGRYSEIPLLEGCFYPGVTGFVGLKICLDARVIWFFDVAGSYFYMGSALGVKIDEI